MNTKDAIESLRGFKNYCMQENPVFGVTTAAQAFDVAIAALERDRWISVEERLPEYGEKCLVAFKLNGHNDWSIQVSYCYVQKEGFWSDCGRDYKAVAWRPLPEPPKEET